MMAVLSLSAQSAVDQAIHRALRTRGHFLNEDDFQIALQLELSRLGPCERERRAEFGPALYPPPAPPPPYKTIDVCKKRGSRKVDIVVGFGSEHVAIEVKFSRFSSWRGTFRGVPLPNPSQSDTLPYEFLKDIHRMERLKEVRFRGESVLPQYRICAFLSNNPFECEDQTLHDRMRLCTRTLSARHLVQYNELTSGGRPTSPNTLWRDYPPFYLANSYDLAWRDLNNDVTDFVRTDGESRNYSTFKLMIVAVSYVPVRRKPGTAYADKMRTMRRNGTKVFIAGSRRLSRLNKDVKRRINNIIDKGFTVIVGDANGIDKAVQQYLSSRNYSNVVVFCMEGGCRNNVGDWPTRTIRAADPGRRDFAYYSTKDRVMVEEADYGLMLWDGKSRGTLTNVVDLVQQGRAVVVYVAPAKTFATLHEPEQLADFGRRFDPAILQRIERDLHTTTTARHHHKADVPLF